MEFPVSGNILYRFLRNSQIFYCNAETCSAFYRHIFAYFALFFAGVAELADALDSKSGVLLGVWVRLPPPVPSMFSCLNL